MGLADDWDEPFSLPRPLNTARDYKKQPQETTRDLSKYQVYARLGVQSPGMVSSRTVLELKDSLRTEFYGLGLEVVWPWPWVGSALASNILSPNPLTDCKDGLYSGLSGLTRRICEHLLVLHYLFNTFLSNLKMFLLLQSRSEMQPSGDGWSRHNGVRLRPVGSSESQQVVRHSAATSGESVISTSHFSSRWAHFQPEQSHHETESCATLQKLLCKLVFLKCSINVWPLNVWSNDDVVSHCINSAILSCQESKIKFSKSFAVSLLYAVYYFSLVNENE